MEEPGHCIKGDFFCEYFAIPALVIVFRETLEATVLLAVLLQFLKRAGQSENLNKQVWRGAAVGCAGTFVFMAIILTIFYSGLGLMDPKAAYITEGILLGCASIELTYFFVTHLAPGMKSNSQWKAKWETNLDEMVQKVISSGENNKFFWLTATTVFREGFEAVVFITPFAAAYRPLALIIPSLVGLVVGVVLGIMSFIGSNKMDLTFFFVIASIFFLFMSAGLASHASYEFQKAEVFGTWYCEPKNLCDDAIEIIEEEAEEVGYRRFLSGDDAAAALDDDPCVTYEEADDAFAYRRLDHGDDDELFSRSHSCDGHPNREVAWWNVEVWDITACCDVKGGEGSSLIFFILMILFWYRPLMTRGELIVMCLYWPITLYWGFGKVSAIQTFNAGLGKKVAPAPVDEEKGAVKPEAEEGDAEAAASDTEVVPIEDGGVEESKGQENGDTEA